MEQMYLIEVFVERVILKIEPPEKDEYELQQEAERLRLLAEAEALAKKGKKGKGGNADKGKGKGKGKGKTPPGPSPEELNFLELSTVTFDCKPLFSFYLTHDRFLPPIIPPKESKKGKKKEKPKKGKKGANAVKLVLPSEPLPVTPDFGVGNSILVLLRPSRLKELMKANPMKVNVWNRDANMNCVGHVNLIWDQSFFDLVDQSELMNPLRLDTEMHNPQKPEVIVNTVEYIKKLECEEDLTLSGEVTVYVRMASMGNRICSNFILVPPQPDKQGVCMLEDGEPISEITAFKHYDLGEIQDMLTIGTLYAPSDFFNHVLEDKVVIPKDPDTFEEYKAPFTSSELAIMAMGIPKGPCGGTNCLQRLSNRGTDERFVPGYYIDGKYITGKFVNVRDVKGPCGRLECPLGRKIRKYLENEGAYKPCMKPCTKDYY